MSLMAFLPNFSETSYEKEMVLKAQACGALQTQMNLKRKMEQVYNSGLTLSSQALNCRDRGAVYMIQQFELYIWWFPLKQMFSCSRQLMSQNYKPDCTFAALSMHIFAS